MKGKYTGMFQDHQTQPKESIPCKGRNLWCPTEVISSFCRIPVWMQEQSWPNSWLPESNWQSPALPFLQFLLCHAVLSVLEDRLLLHASNRDACLGSRMLLVCFVSAHRASLMHTSVHLYLVHSFARSSWADPVYVAVFSVYSGCRQSGSLELFHQFWRLGQLKCVESCSIPHHFSLRFSNTEQP